MMKFAILILVINYSFSKFSYRHSHKKKVYGKMSKSTHTHSRNAKALENLKEPEDNQAQQGAKDTLINVARDQNLDTIEMNKAYAEYSHQSSSSEEGKSTLIMMNYEKYSKFLMSTRGLDFDHPCKMKQGYLLQIYGEQTTNEDSGKIVLMGRPSFAVLNKQVLSLFENEHVSGLRKLINLKEIKSSYIPRGWNSLNCLVIVMRGADESQTSFKTNHISLVKMGFDVNNPNYVTLCAEDAAIRDSWLKAINTYQTCQVRVVEDEGTKNVNFEITKIRKKKVSDELSAQQEREQEMQEKMKEQQERFNEEWKLKMRKLRMEYYKKKMEERKKKFEIMAERKKEEELTRKFREDEDCLEKKIESDAGIQETAAEKDVLEESEKRKQSVFDKLDDKVQKQMDFERIIQSSEEEDINEQEREIQEKLKQLMVQETVGFEKIESPDACYDESLSSASRDSTIKKVCGQIIGPLMDSGKIRTLVECLNEDKFCHVCCEANIGYVMIRERLLCVRKCSSLLEMVVSKNVEVKQINKIGNYKSILKTVKMNNYTNEKYDHKSSYQLGGLPKPPNGYPPSTGGSGGSGGTSVEGPEHPDFTPNEHPLPEGSNSGSSEVHIEGSRMEENHGIIDQPQPQPIIHEDSNTITSGGSLNINGEHSSSIIGSSSISSNSHVREHSMSIIGGGSSITNSGKTRITSIESYRPPVGQEGFYMITTEYITLILTIIKSKLNIVYQNLIGYSVDSSVQFQMLGIKYDSDASQLRETYSLDIRMVKGFVSGLETHFIGFQQKYFLIEIFNALTFDLKIGSKILAFGSLTIRDIKFLHYNEDMILKSGLSTSIPSLENYYRGATGASYYTTSTVRPVTTLKRYSSSTINISPTYRQTYSYTSPAIIRTSSFSLPSTQTQYKTTVKRSYSSSHVSGSFNGFNKKMRFRQKENSPMMNLKSLINAKPSSMGAATISSTSEESKSHRNKLKMIFGAYKMKQSRRKGNGKGEDLSGFEKK